MEEKDCTKAKNSEDKYIELAQSLTDEMLTSAGLQKITAFMRNEQSSNAKRKQRSREKAEQQGVKQLNIQLPVHMHAMVKDIAQELQRTADANLALKNILVKTGAYESVSMPKLNQLQGWRLFVAKLLGLL